MERSEIVVTFVGTVAPKYCIAIFDENFNFLKGYNGVTEVGMSGMTIVEDYIYSLDIRNVYKFDRDLNLLDKSFEPIGMDLHGLTHSYLLYAVNTREGNIVAIKSKDLKVYHNTYEYNLNDDPESAHINSVCINPTNNDLVLAITVHNMNNEGYVFEYNPLSDTSIVLARNLSQPHDYTYMSNGYIVNNSAKNQVIYSKVPIEKSWTVDLGGYTRGLCVSRNSIYVGVSRRDEEFCEIVKLDMNGNQEKRFKFSKEKFGTEIYAIGVL